MKRGNVFGKNDHKKKQNVPFEESRYCLLLLFGCLILNFPIH